MNRLQPHISKVMPFTAKLAKPFVSRKSLSALADSVEVLCSEEEYDFPPIFMFDEDWDKVISTQAETDIELERARVLGGRRRHAPTELFSFSNVLATPNGFFTLGRSFCRYGNVPIRELFAAGIPSIRSGLYPLSSTGLRYFGHWLLDGLPATLLLKDGQHLYIPHHHSWTHADGYRRILGLPAYSHRYVFFEHLTYSPDFGQNSHRRCRIRDIHRHIAKHTTSMNGHGVFIRRGSSGSSRLLINEDDIAEALQNYGFRVCCVHDSFNEILATCSGAGIVVSMEGSQLGHAFLMAQEGALLVSINPCDRFNNVHADYLPALNQRLATVVANRAATGYEVDIDRLLEIIDYARNQMAKS